MPKYGTYGEYRDTVRNIHDCVFKDSSNAIDNAHFKRTVDVAESTVLPYLCRYETPVTDEESKLFLFGIAEKILQRLTYQILDYSVIPESVEQGHKIAMAQLMDLRENRMCLPGTEANSATASKFMGRSVTAKFTQSRMVGL